MLQDRRQYIRVVPNLPQLVCFGESQTSFLFDLGEGGLAIGNLAPKSRDEVITLVFDLPEGYGHIQTRGEIAWTSDSGHRAGLRFVDLADTSWQQLREWNSARAATTRLGAGVTLEEPAQPVFDATDSIDLVNPEARTMIS